MLLRVRLLYLLSGIIYHPSRKSCRLSDFVSKRQNEYNNPYEYRSGTVMLGKEGVSTLAGYGASNLVYDKTNNQTLGMIAGILASTDQQKD